jgi:hypothetical protein
MSSFSNKTITRQKTNFVPWTHRYIASAMDVGYLGRCQNYLKRLCIMQCWSEYSLKRLEPTFVLPLITWRKSEKPTKLDNGDIKTHWKAYKARHRKSFEVVTVDSVRFLLCWCECSLQSLNNDEVTTHCKGYDRIRVLQFLCWSGGTLKT